MGGLWAERLIATEASERKTDCEKENKNHATKYGVVKKEKREIINRKAEADQNRGE